MTKPILAALAASTLLAGCDLAPHYLRPTGAVPLSLPQAGIYPSAATDAPDVTRVGWRDFFLDERLRHVIAAGLDNNRDLRVAVANVLQARGQLRAQRADLFPTLAANASATYTNNPLSAAGGSSGAGGSTGAGGVGTGTTGSGVGTGGSTDYHYFSVDAGVSNFELDLFGRIRNLNRAQQEQVLASEESQRATHISIVAEIASAWLTMAADQDQLRLSRQSLAAFKQTFDLTSAQFRIGVGSELEVRQAETNYQGARNDIAALETQIAQDQNALNLLAGTTVAAEDLPNGLGEAQPTRDALPASLSSDVLLRRPDVLQAEHQLIAESANIGAARAAFFPTVSLTGTLGTISTALSSLFGGGSFSYTGQPAVSLPLFDAGRRRGNLDYARASQQAALATYERSIQIAFREAADALAQRGRIGEQVDAQTARANAATVAARLSDARYRAGVDSFLTTLDAQRTAYAAEQQLVSTRLTRADNLVTLYRVLGGGLN